MMKMISIPIGFGLLLSGVAHSQTLSMEERMTILEARLSKTEERANNAENQVAVLKKQLMASSLDNKAPTKTVAPINDAVSSKPKENSPPNTLTLNDYGDLKFYGDVEFNVDAASRSGQLSSLKSSSSNSDWKPGTTERWDVNGRVLLGFDGYRHQDNGDFAGFRVQPLAKLKGTMGIDDAAFFFGKEKDWQIKVGRFESYNMFPLNQDTFIEYSGNTANNLYADGYGYIYMMKEGRGRSSDGGNVLFSKSLGKWYFELNSLFENGTSLFSDADYHGNSLENKKNAIYLRPVVAWQGQYMTAAAAIETNVVNDAYGYTASDGQWKNQSKRNGYGTTIGWNTNPLEPLNNIQFNFNTAYLDATGEKDMTIGLNGLWRGFELGYIYAHNDIQEFNLDNEETDADGPITSPGKYDIHTLHASYLIPNVMNMKNFNMYIGLYSSWLKKETNNQMVNGHDDQRYGARIRFKYYF